VKRLLTVISLVALALAACSSSGASGGVASLDETATTTTTDPQQGQTSTEDALLAYAQCMRDQGIDMPDPTFDGEGGFGLRVQPGAEGTFDRQHMDAARQACQQYLEGIQQNFQRPDLSQIQDNLIAFSQCMRDQGISDFPDPDLSDFGPGSGGGPTTGGDGGFGPFAGVDFSDPAVQAAAQACQGEFGGQGGFGFRFGGSGDGGAGVDVSPPTTTGGA
jgi:hypothetical protein